MAEWLGKALQKLLQRFESARDLSKRLNCLKIFGSFFICNDLQLGNFKLSLSRKIIHINTLNFKINYILKQEFKLLHSLAKENAIIVNQTILKQMDKKHTN